MAEKNKSAKTQKKSGVKKAASTKASAKKFSSAKNTLKSAKAAPKSKPAKKATPVKLTMQSRVRRNDEVAWRIIDGEAVIVTPADSVMHTLNDVGTRIWELLTGERNLKEIAQLLCADFDVDEKRAQADTIWFVNCLQKKGLIQAAG